MVSEVSGTAGCSVSVLVFTLNEDLNLPHCLASLEWCDDVVVVDSFSTDGTLEICSKQNVRSAQHAFSGFGDQRNWALDELQLKHQWILILDADERVPPELALELNQLARTSPEHIGAYRLKRRFYLWGKWLRHSSLYPNWVVRFAHKDKIRYANRGHSESQSVDGEIGEIRGYLIDENHKDLDAWFERQVRYARQEAEFELEIEGHEFAWSDLASPEPLRRRAALKRIASRLPLRGFFYFLYSYVVRLGFLDGTAGYMFCRMKAMYQSMIVANKYELRRTGGAKRR